MLHHGYIPNDVQEPGSQLKKHLPIPFTLNCGSICWAHIVAGHRKIHVGMGWRVKVRSQFKFQALGEGNGVPIAGMLGASIMETRESVDAAFYPVAELPPKFSTVAFPSQMLLDPLTSSNKLET